MLGAAHLRVMSFNVRQMDGDDGPNDWEHRKKLLVETIQMWPPGLLGTQEIFAEQAAFIMEEIPALNSFGRGRFGDSRDKHNLIFFDRNRFSLVDTGELWFSETPEVPGSLAWGIPRPRMVTWGRLRRSEGTDVLILNSHLPYGRNADEARRRSAHIVLQAIAQLPGDLPLFLTGDFNSPAGGEIYALLTHSLQDSWKTAQRTIGPEGTLNGFGRLPERLASRRIDWILHRNTDTTLEAEVVNHKAGELYPSDHYPVTATFLVG
jgi:endonuclease/exonuclease/phosphatase family metal-dependent hydrolase